jgi:hypothetical protein
VGIFLRQRKRWLPKNAAKPTYTPSASILQAVLQSIVDNPGAAPRDPRFLRFGDYFPINSSVSLAIEISSFVGMTQTCTVLSGAEIGPSAARVESFAAGSSFTPRNSSPSRISARAGEYFSH